MRETTPIELLVNALEREGWPIGTVLIPEQCAEVYINGKWHHVTVKI